MPKITQNPGLEGSGGLWGEVWEPWWSPGGPRSPKIFKNHVRGPPWDPPVGVHFRHFLRLFGVFLWIFFQTFLLWIFYRFQTSPDLKNSGFAKVKQCFSEKRRSRPGSHFGINLAPFWEALGHQNREKRVPESTPEKGSPKSSARLRKVARDGTRRGGCVPYTMKV